MHGRKNIKIYALVHNFCNNISMYISFVMHLPEYVHMSGRKMQVVYGVYNKLSYTHVHLLVLISYLIPQCTVMEHLKLIQTNVLVEVGVVCTVICGLIKGTVFWDMRPWSPVCLLDQPVSGLRRQESWYRITVATKLSTEL